MGHPVEVQQKDKTRLVQEASVAPDEEDGQARGKLKLYRLRPRYDDGCHDYHDSCQNYHGH